MARASPPANAREAIAWLASRGASAWLVRHHELVLEAAEALCTALPGAMRMRFDVDRVLLGAALHDAGKLLHPSEMGAPGHAHEAAGEALLRAAGLRPEIARCAVTHAQWNDPRADLEDRLVALADKLWKGKRDEALETALTAELAARTGRPSWEVFATLDGIATQIAEDGPERLRRSAV